ncbi:hypothetical protein JRQ81_009430 [Phrynocephalus forsythii]|uniref:Major facilitator superfamily (MFS) profile domain-containing protein n=1 Tax=Phrynocephalus forsythii TaxID=171643 RepID=A0A9Q1ASI4_9SAUR|nr:hypothetical protein JRQ81_009430 [Phrynocephalus forsythii]
MSFAELLEHVGSMGCFQVLYVTLLSLPLFFMSPHMVLQNFTAATPDHYCVPHRWAFPGNRTLEDEDLLKVSIPLDEKGRPEQCRRYARDQWWLLNATVVNRNGGGIAVTNKTAMETEPCRDGWAYDRSVFPSTITMEWDLVCSSRSLKEMAQSLYMGGVLLGGIVFGNLSDRFGRRGLLIWSYLQLATTGTATAFSPNFTVYCVFRFLTGMAYSGVVFSCLSLFVEWTPMRTRAILGTWTGIAFTIGQLLLAGLAYLVPGWRELQLVVSTPYFLFFAYSWWFAESARWLVMAGKPGRALNVLQKVARINGKPEAGEKLTLEFLRAKMKNEMASQKSSYSCLDLVRTPIMRRISCCLCFVWFSTGFAYYGLVMDLQNFGINIYLMQAVFSLVDFPSKFISAISLTYAGRRFTQAVTLMLAGFSIIVNIFIPEDMRAMRTAFAVFGKGCLAASFNCVFLYTGELFPTVLRQTGMGLSNTMARLGGMVAPVVKMSGEYLPFLPHAIYGAAPIVSGLAAAFLPETLNIPLPDTITQVENRSPGWKDEEQQQMQELLDPSKPDFSKITI